MYKQNEILRLLGDIGKEGEANFIAKGTEVEFVKAIDVDLKSFVVVRYGERLVTISELAVAPTETNALDELKKFNKRLMRNSPELKKYHHNIFARFYYTLADFFRKVLTRKPKKAKVEDRKLDDIKKLINSGWEDIE